MADPVTPVGSKSEKFNKAVARATGADAPVAMTPAEAAAAAANGASSMIKKADAAKLTEMMVSNKWEFAPQNVTLEEGDVIEGILEGVGPGNDFTNDEGEIYHVDSWVITSPDGNMRASILSSAQLDRKLPPFIGAPVYIQRGRDLKMSNGHRCTDYLVGGAKLPDGAKRTFSDASPKAKQLAAPAPETIPAIQNGANAAPHEDLTA